MTKPKPFDAEELIWAKKNSTLIGFQGTPEEFLNLRWSEVVKLALERGFEWWFQPAPKTAPSSKARRPKSKK